MIDVHNETGPTTNRSSGVGPGLLLSRFVSYYSTEIEVANPSKSLAKNFCLSGCQRIPAVAANVLDPPENPATCGCCDELLYG
jgi:hypothetical protein